MTRHLDAVSVTEHRVVLALAREFADRAELAEATIQRVREFLADKDEGLTDEARAQGHFILVDTDSVRRALEGDNDD